MLIEKTLSGFLDELSSANPVPGGGSAAALACAVGASLTAMVCTLTIGRKKYLPVEAEMKGILEKSERLRSQFTENVDRDAEAFGKVMEAYNLPKESLDQQALRKAAIEEATKEAALVPLSVMKHALDAMALAKAVAERGNVNSVSDAGVSALMLQAGAESAALNVQINLKNIGDTDFVGWHSEEVATLLRTIAAKSEEIRAVVRGRID